MYVFVFVSYVCLGKYRWYIFIILVSKSQLLSRRWDHRLKQSCMFLFLFPMFVLVSIGDITLSFWFPSLHDCWLWHFVMCLLAIFKGIFSRQSVSTKKIRILFVVWYIDFLSEWYVHFLLIVFVSYYVKKFFFKDYIL